MCDRQLDDEHQIVVVGIQDLGLSRIQDCQKLKQKLNIAHAQQHKDKDKQKTV